MNISEIHTSVSTNGSSNVLYSKPSMILKALEILNLPILYLDCDMVLKENIVLFNDFKHDNIDFSILNWLSLKDNSAYVPVIYEDTTYYNFSHEINFQSDNQLICSGAVQYWNNTNLSKLLLSKWLKTIIAQPFAQDDHSLDYSFNNFDNSDIITYWLPKSYCRYFWWIFDDPIIDHPDIPNQRGDSEKLIELDGLPRVHVEKLTPKNSTRRSEKNQLFKI